MFGKDFFKWFQFVIELIKLLSKIFGNGEEAEEIETVLNNVNGKSKKPSSVPNKT